MLDNIYNFFSELFPFIPNFLNRFYENEKIGIYIFSVIILLILLKVKSLKSKLISVGLILFVLFIDISLVRNFSLVGVMGNIWLSLTKVLVGIIFIVILGIFFSGLGKNIFRRRRW